MGQNHESPFGVYGNLCVLYFDGHKPYHRLRCFGIAPPSPEVHRIASDGDLGKFLGPVSLPDAETDYAFGANSVIEMHAFLVTLIRQFDFSLPGNGHEVKRNRPLGILLPIVVGEEHKGPQMPLRVTALRNE